MSSEKMAYKDGFDEGWSRSQSKIAQLESDNAALRECILAMENDQACLPEDVSVTEYVIALKKRIDELEKEYGAGSITFEARGE